MKTEQFIFREAMAGDIPRLKFIRDNVKENALVSATIDEGEYHKCLFQNGKGWVCEVAGQAIGFSCGRLAQGDVWALFIDSKYEGMGIGNKLMELLEGWMLLQGCKEIKLSTTPGTRAERLYRRRNWQFVGLNKKGEADYVLRP